MGATWPAFPPCASIIAAAAYMTVDTRSDRHFYLPLRASELVQNGDTTFKYSLPSCCIKWTVLRPTSELLGNAPRCAFQRSLGSYYYGGCTDVSKRKRNYALASVSAHSDERCLKDACVPCEAMAAALQ